MAIIPRRSLGPLVIAMTLSVVLGAGCQSAGDFDSLNPYDRTRAIVVRAEAGDATAVHRLVALLDDEDSAVRMYAIVALKRLCGTDYGYRYYDCQDDRAAAVARWREAIQNGDVALRTPGDTRRELSEPTDGAPADDAPGQPPRDAARS
ncbi:MAG: HEAT repeat domain-containing protein [Phycisphaerae bacterium]|nr:HEAT repeat domain-containing protein [Phycisphaerae bacterium]